MQVMDAWEEAVEEQRKWQQEKGWQTPKWDRNWVAENCFNWEALRAEFQKWQESSKSNGKEEKGSFIGLLTEALAAAGTLFKTTRQKLETASQGALQQPTATEARSKGAAVRAPAFESCSFIKSHLLQQLETNLTPLALSQLDQEHVRPVSDSEITEETHTLNTDNEEDSDFSNGLFTPTSLPESNPDETASLYPITQIPPPGRHEGSLLPPQVTMTEINLNAGQLWQKFIQFSKKSSEDWLGWVARCYQMGAGALILNQNEARQIFLGGGIVLHNPDAEAGKNTFSLLSSIIHAVRQMQVRWGYSPPPPWNTRDGFAKWTMRLAAWDALKAQGAIPEDMMSLMATEAGKSRLLENAAYGGAKGLALMLYSRTYDWNTIMAQGLQYWVAFMKSTPKSTAHQREGWVRTTQTPRGNHKKGQNVRKFPVEINRSNIRRDPDKQERDLERRRHLQGLLQGIGFTPGQLDKMPTSFLQRLWDNRKIDSDSTPSMSAENGPDNTDPSAPLIPIPDDPSTSLVSVSGN